MKFILYTFDPKLYMLHDSHCVQISVWSSYNEGITLKEPRVI